MRYCMGAAALAVIVASHTANAQERERGGLGARCAARADCRDGLRCFENACVDEATFEATRSGESSDHGDGSGARAYVGGALGASLPTIWGTWGEGFQLALHVGALINGTVQLQLEASPAATVLTNLGLSPSGYFDVAGTLGYLVPISKLVSWIVRVGGGGGVVFPYTTGASSSAFGFAEFRLDVFGAAIRTSDHLLVEVNVPSFRLMYLPYSSVPYPNNDLLWMWVTNVAVSYVF